DIIGVSALEDYVDRTVVRRVTKWLYANEHNVRVAHDLSLTDDGNVNRLFTMHGDVLRYVPAERRWFVWDGRHWERGYDHSVIPFLLESVKAFAGTISTMSTAQAQQALTWVRSSLMGPRLREGAKIAATAYPHVHMELDQFDGDPYLFNFTNGTYDLSTSELRPFDVNDYLTKMAGVAYNQTAVFDHSRQFLLDVFGGSEALIDYVQRLFGYALLGEQ